MKNLCFLLLFIYLSFYSNAQSNTGSCIRLKGRELVPGEDKNIEAGGTKLIGKTKEEVKKLIGKPREESFDNPASGFWFYTPKECDGKKDTPLVMRVLFRDAKVAEAVLLIE